MAESNSIIDWLDEISASETLPNNIEALYIGLFEGDDCYNIYMIGSERFDEEDEDWACDGDFVPQSKYLETGIPTSEDWKAFMDEVVIIVKDYLDTTPDSILSKVNHVGIGFDDGDIAVIK